MFLKHNGATWPKYTFPRLGMERSVWSKAISTGDSLHLRGDKTRTRGRGKKERSKKRGYKSVIFEDASSIPYTSLWMDVRFVVTYAEMSPEIVEGEEGRRSLGMVYNRIKVREEEEEKGRYFSVSASWTSYGRSWEKLVGGKLVITRAWLLREGEIKESSGR